MSGCRESGIYRLRFDYVLLIRVGPQGQMSQGGCGLRGLPQDWFGQEAAEPNLIGLALEGVSTSRKPVSGQLPVCRPLAHNRRLRA
jgi:hypothetical protein